MWHSSLVLCKVPSALSRLQPYKCLYQLFIAQSSKPRLGQWLDEFGSKYSKVVLGVTAAMLLLLPLVGVPLLDSATQRGAVYRAMGVLTVASPCALVVVPSAYIAAIACTSFRCKLDCTPRRT